MPDQPDEQRPDRMQQPADHFASKLDAFRSDVVQALVKNMLIVGGVASDAQVLVSLLRASLGRQVEARSAIGLTAVTQSLAAQMPDLVVVRDNPAQSTRGADVLAHLRAAGFEGPVIAIYQRVLARDAVALHRAGALDVIEVDDLNSVRLFEALLKAAQLPSPPPIDVACLAT